MGALGWLFRTRAWRMNNLGRLAARGKVDTVSLSLVDEDPLVRRAAAEALGGVPPPAAGDTLILALRDPAPAVRAAAAEALGRREEVRAAGSLIPLLADIAEDYGTYGGRSVSVFAYAALAAMGRDAVPALIEALQSDDSRLPTGHVFIHGAGEWKRTVLIRHAVIDLLARAADERAVMPIAAFSTDQDERLRRAAFLALGMLKDPRTIELLARPLFELKQKSQVDDACWRVEALQGMQSPLVVDALLEVLEFIKWRRPGYLQHGFHNLSDLQDAVVAALCLQSDPRIVEPLSAILSASLRYDPSAPLYTYGLGTRTVENIVAALRRVGGDQAEPPLAELERSFRERGAG